MEKKCRKIEYNVFPKQKTVVAKGLKDSYLNIYEETEMKSSKVARKVVEKILIYNSEFPHDLDIIYGKDFTGVARCYEGDEFNERVGKEIATCKADMKYHDAIARKYGLIMRMLEETYKELRKLQKYHENKVDNIVEDIDRYYK